MANDPVLNYADPPARPALTPEPAAVSAQQLAALGCKLIALWLFAQSVGAVLGAACLLVTAVVGMPFGRQGLRATDLTSVMTSLAFVVGPIAAGVVLWARADWLARRMVADGTATALSNGPGYGGLLSIGLVLVGAAVAVPAARDLARAAASAARRHASFANWWRDPYWTGEFWSDAAGLALAAWLMFGSGGIARLVTMARSAGVHPPDQPAR